MRALFVAAGIIAVSVWMGPGLAWINKPPTNADFSFGPGAAQSSNTFTTGGGVDLPVAGESQDPEAELEGNLCNNFTGKKRQIADITCWVEDSMGNILTGPGGGPLVEELKSSASAGGTLKTATPVASSGGAQTFNLQDEINAGACGNYSMQIGQLVSPPNRWTLAVTTSSEKVSIAKHYDNLGEGSFTSLAHTKLFDAQPRSVRAGVTLDVHNFDTTKRITDLRITLITNGPVTMTGCTVDDMVAGLPIAGASIAVDGDGLGVTVSGLSQVNPDGVMVWLDTTDPIDDPATFRVRATFSN